MPNINYFDIIANQWDDIRKGFFQNEVREKAVELSKIKRGDVAADIGAGTGFISEILLEKGAHVIAIDQSVEMLSQLKKNSVVTLRLQSKKVMIQIYRLMIIRLILHLLICICTMLRIRKLQLVKWLEFLSHTVS